MKKLIVVLLFVFLGFAILFAGFVITALVMRNGIDSLSFGLSDYEYKGAESYSQGDASISANIARIDIDWISGNIIVKAGDEVSFYEQSNETISDDMTLRYLVEGDTLTIKYCKSGRYDANEMVSKDLHITLDASTLEHLKLDSISADISIDGISPDRFEVETTSGDIKITGCDSCDILDAESISGNIEINIGNSARVDLDNVSGLVDVNGDNIGSLSIETVSGDTALFIRGSLSGLEFESVSGDLSLYLPSNSSFDLEFESTSGSFRSEHPALVRGDRYIFGEGGPRYEADTVSGDVKIF